MLHPFLSFLAPGGGEMLVIMLALLLLFGPKDAPRILRRGLEALRKIQQSANRFKNDLLAENPDTEDPARTRDTAIYDRAQAASKPSPAPPPPPPPGETPP